MTVLPNRQIEMGGARTFEDFRLASAPPERVREVSVVSSAYDSVLCGSFTYVSTPITSGLALYRALDETGMTDPEQLRKDRDLFRRLVMEPNFAAADRVAETMLSLGGAVIAPAAFEARSLGWDQDAYMGLWLDTIERKATRLALVDGWEYSNGGAEEYLQALLMQAGRRDRNDIEIVDARGSVMTHARALELLAMAIDGLLARGFRPLTLARVFHRAVALHGMVEDEGRYGQLADRCGRTVFSISPAYVQAFDGRDLRETMRDLRPAYRTATEIVPEEERHPGSSLEMAPGLVRADGRTELAEAPARVVTPATDEDS